MGDQLDKSYRYVIEANSTAAVELLVGVLEGESHDLRDRALRGLMTARHPTARRELLRRWSLLPPALQEVMREDPRALLQALEGILKSPDESAYAGACQTITTLRLYGALTTLLPMLCRKDLGDRKLIAKTILTLVDSFYEEMAEATDDEQRRKLRDQRDWVTSCLEDSVRNFNSHQQSEVLEAFLIVARRKNKMLARILDEPHGQCYETITELLLESPRGGVIRLILSWIDVEQAPALIEQVFATRCDEKFLDNLVQLVAKAKNRNEVAMLKQLRSVMWTQSECPVFDSLGEWLQAAAMRLLTYTSISRADTLEMVKRVLERGKPAARRAAAETLLELKGPAADAVVAQWINDRDPDVVALLVGEVRPRNLPNAMGLLLGLIDTQHWPIRKALAKALPEFGLTQFMAGFEGMTETQRASTGRVVAALAPDLEERLLIEMGAPVAFARRRAVLASAVLGVAARLQRVLIDRLLSDDDQIVRAAAAQALAQTSPARAIESLTVAATSDRSGMVRTQAEDSISRLQAAARAEEDSAQREAAVEAELSVARQQAAAQAEESLARLKAEAELEESLAHCGAVAPATDSTPEEATI